MKKYVTMFVFAAMFIGQTRAALIIDFEDFAQAGSRVNVSSRAPYLEDGFLFNPTGNKSAVFSATASQQLVGNTSDWFGFYGSVNPITMTFTGPGERFDLQGLMIGRHSDAANPTIDFQMVGTTFGGETLSAFFTGISSATTVDLNWVGLTSVVFTASGYAGIDNLVIDRVTVPEPASLGVLGLALLAIGRFSLRR